jgi:uncharacterized Zn-finger protein
MTGPEWTKGKNVTCPDCGYEFGRRTAAQTLILTYEPKSLRAQCIRMTEKNQSDLQCPRFEEVTAVADSSERVHPGNKPSQP